MVDYWRKSVVCWRVVDSQPYIVGSDDLEWLTGSNLLIGVRAAHLSEEHAKLEGMVRVIPQEA